MADSKLSAFTTLSSIVPSTDYAVMLRETGPGVFVNRKVTMNTLFADYAKGATSTIDNTVPRFDGTGGKLLQSSLVVVDDSGNVSGLGTLNSKALPAGNIVGTSDTQTLTNKSISASQINSGVLATARLGTGTANSTVFLRGDGTWASAGGAASLPFVLWEPSDPTGATNMSSELETLVAANPGRNIKIKSGVTILLNAFGASLSASLDVNIDATDVLILYDAGSKCVYVDNSSNASAAVNVSSITTQTVNTDARVSRVTLASTLSIQKFDVVAIFSTDANPAKSGGKLAEIIQVMTNETSLVFDTMERLRRGSAYLTSVQCRKLNKTRKFKWIGGTFKANGDANDAAITSRLQCIHIVGFVDPVVRGCTFDRPWAMCVDVQACAFGTFEQLEMKDVANLSASNGYTYGVRTYAMNYGHVIRNIKTRNGRHPAFTTDGNTSSSTWYQLGIPTNITVQTVSGMNCHGTLVDTHEEGDGIIFDGIENINPVQLSTSNLTGTLIQTRCANVLIKNITQIGGARVIKVNAVDHGFRDKVVIQGVTVNGTQDGTDTDCIIECDDQSALTNKRDIQVTDINATDVGLLFLIGKKVPISIDRVFASKIDTVGDVYGGAEVIVGEMMVDYRNNTRNPTNYGWKCRSDVTNGGCKIIHTVKPIILKGATATNPPYWFDERDTTANKTVFAPGLIEYNPSAVTPTDMYEPGATTLIKATDITGAEVIPGTLAGPGYITNRYYGPWIAGTTNSANLTANTMYFCTMYVYERHTFTGIGFFPSAVTGTVNAHFGIYTNNNGAPGKLVTGTDVTVTALTAAAAATATFGAGVTLEPGWYHLVVLLDGVATLTAVGASNANSALFGTAAAGETTSTNTGIRVTASQTYGALPSNSPAASIIEGQSMVLLKLKA